MDLTVLVDHAVLAPQDKHASEDDVFVTVIVLPDIADLMLVELTAVSALLDKPVSTVSVLVPVPLNASELSTELPRPVVGTDAVETVEVAQVDSVARMVFVYAIPNALPETVALMVAEDLAVLVLVMLSVTATSMIPPTELATSLATDVVMEFAHQLRLLPLFVLLNSIKPTAHKTVVPLLELSLLPSVKRIN